MNKLFKFFMLFTLSLSILVVSCKDDEEPPVTVPSPTITSVTPTQGTVGTAVTITGTNLENVSRVTFGGVNAENFNPDDNTSTTITASVPAGLEAGAQNIVVTSPGGTAQTNFTVVEDDVTPGEPTIVSFDPVSGNVGDPVTITGTDLDLADSAFIGDVRIMDWEVADDAATATFTIPEGAQTGTFVIYHGDDATAVESATEFTVGDGATGDAPVITRFTPASGPVGDSVTITGTNLNMADSAFIGDVQIMDWEVAEDGNSATFTIPEGAETGTFRLSVEGGEDVETMETFTVGEPFATITSFDPMTGAVGQSVTIMGTNLNMADTARIGGVVITDWMAAEDGTSATFTIPEGATTDVITIVNAEGARVVSTDEFTIDGGDGGTGENVVFESTFSPISGPRDATTQVTVTAADETNFTGATSVMIGETEIAAENYTIAEDGSSITFTIPETAVGGNLVVEMADGTMVQSNTAFAFGTSPAGENVYQVGTANTAFGDALGEGWQIWDGWGNTTSDPENTEIEGTTSIRVDYAEAGGGFQLHPEPAIDLEGDEAIVLSIFGAEGAGNVWMYVRPTDLPAGENVADEDKVELEVVAGEWRTYVIPVSSLTNAPTSVNELVLQNRDVAPSTIYVDNVTLIQ